MHQHTTALYLDGNKFSPVEVCASLVLSEGAHLAECTRLDCGSDDKPGARNACIYVVCVCMCVCAHMYVCTLVLCLCICMSDCACVCLVHTQFRGERLETYQHNSSVQHRRRLRSTSSQLRSTHESNVSRMFLFFSPATTQAGSRKRQRLSFSPLDVGKLVMFLSS